jgi:hypothetical protein
MRRRIGNLALALATCVALVAPAVPAAAVSQYGTDPDAVPLQSTLFVPGDVVMRAMGVGLTAVGFVSFVAASPIIGITRPGDIGRAWRAMVVHPAHFTWVDPLGRHPERPDAVYGDIRAEDALQQ